MDKSKACEASAEEQWERASAKTRAIFIASVMNRDAVIMKLSLRLENGKSRFAKLITEELLFDET